MVRRRIDFSPRTCAVILIVLSLTSIGFAVDKSYECNDRWGKRNFLVSSCDECSYGETTCQEPERTVLLSSEGTFVDFETHKQNGSVPLHVHGKCKTSATLCSSASSRKREGISFSNGTYIRGGRWYCHQQNDGDTVIPIEKMKKSQIATSACFYLPDDSLFHYATTTQMAGCMHSQRLVVMGDSMARVAMTFPLRRLSDNGNPTARDKPKAIQPFPWKRAVASVVPLWYTHWTYDNMTHPLDADILNRPNSYDFTRLLKSFVDTDVFLPPIQMYEGRPVTMPYSKLLNATPRRPLAVWASIGWWYVFQATHQPALPLFQHHLQYIVPLLRMYGGLDEIASLPNHMHTSPQSTSTAQQTAVTTSTPRPFRTRGNYTGFGDFIVTLPHPKGVLNWHPTLFKMVKIVRRTFADGGVQDMVFDTWNILMTVPKIFYYDKKHPEKAIANTFPHWLFSRVCPPHTATAAHREAAAKRAVQMFPNVLAKRAPAEPCKSLAELYDSMDVDSRTAVSNHDDVFYPHKRLPRGRLLPFCSRDYGLARSRTFSALGLKDIKVETLATYDICRLPSSQSRDASKTEVVNNTAASIAAALKREKAVVEAIAAVKAALTERREGCVPYSGDVVVLGGTYARRVFEEAKAAVSRLLGHTMAWDMIQWNGTMPAPVFASEVAAGELRGVLYQSRSAPLNRAPTYETDARNYEECVLNGGDCAPFFATATPVVKGEVTSRDWEQITVYFPNRVKLTFGYVHCKSVDDIHDATNKVYKGELFKDTDIAALPDTLSSLVRPSVLEQSDVVFPGAMVYNRTVALVYGVDALRELNNNWDKHNFKTELNFVDYLVSPTRIRGPLGVAKNMGKYFRAMETLMGTIATLHDAHHMQSVAVSHYWLSGAPSITSPLKIARARHVTNVHAWLLDEMSLRYFYHVIKTKQTQGLLSDALVRNIECIDSFEGVMAMTEEWSQPKSPVTASMLDSAAAHVATTAAVALIRKVISERPKPVCEPIIVNVHLIDTTNDGFGLPSVSLPQSRPPTLVVMLMTLLTVGAIQYIIMKQHRAPILGRLRDHPSDAVYVPVGDDSKSDGVKDSRADRPTAVTSGVHALFDVNAYGAPVSRSSPRTMASDVDVPANNTRQSHSDGEYEVVLLGSDGERHNMTLHNSSQSLMVPRDAHRTSTTVVMLRSLQVLMIVIAVLVLWY